ncbi:MAG: dihydrodipicolinate synthase family protein, partial [Mesorhizobium sp.]
MAIGPDTKAVYTIAPTPFEADGQIDWESLDSMVDFYERCGVDGMTILGIMGEAPKLDAGESLEIVKRIVARTRLPVIVGVSAPGFAAMRSLARAAMEVGAQGVMIAPLPALRTDDQIVTYFRNASEAVGEDVPFVLQDYP